MAQIIHFMLYAVPPQVEGHTARLDGKLCTARKDFYNEIARELKMPTQYPQYQFLGGLDSFNDNLRDLDYLVNATAYLFLISNYESFLANEPESFLLDVLDIFNSMSKRWGEQPKTPDDLGNIKKEVKIAINDCPKARQDLAKAGFAFVVSNHWQPERPRHFFLFPDKMPEIWVQTYYAVLDGRDCHTLDDFYHALADAIQLSWPYKMSMLRGNLNFVPDYLINEYNFTEFMHAWCFVIHNYECFLAGEPVSSLHKILRFFDKAAAKWHGYDSEEAPGMIKKYLWIFINDCQKARQDLEESGLKYWPTELDKRRLGWMPAEETDSVNPD